MWLYRLNETLRPIFRAYFGVRKHGALECVPSEGPVLVCANHASYLDPWFLGACLSRPIRFLITEDWYYRNKAWEWMFRSWGTIPLARNPLRTIDSVCRALDEGDVVGVFPEGRISDDARLLKFRPGISRMAARSGASVIPVGLRGNYESLPRHRIVPRRGNVAVHFGEPMRFDGAPIQGVPSREASQAFQDQLRAAILDLCQRPDALLEVDGEPLPESPAP